jgi:precorrin-3B methylase
MRQLTWLADTFLAARAPATPVVIAADLGTPAQKTLVISLGTLRDHLDDISLTSLLIIGNSETVLCGDLLTVRR